MLKLVRIIAALLFPVIIAGVLLVGYVDHYFDRRLQIEGDSAVMLLERGTGFSTMVNQAAERGWIAQPGVLKIAARIVPSMAEVRAGEYQVHAGTTVGQWLAMMRNGEVVRHHFTFVEGWTVKQLLSQLKGSPMLADETLVAGPELWAQLGIEAPLAKHPEGLFFPDTYDFHRGDEPSLLLRRAYQRMESVLMDEWEKRQPNLPLATPYEALILASIIEKETGVPGERGEIAGVFIRRLQKGMRLQTDPTIIYGMGDAYQGNIRSRDLRDDSNPYNTYRINGLPPTPIALAGREAIHAALQPEPGSSLFFVAKGDGSQYFSETLAEHEAAVRQYQLRRRQDYRSSPAPKGAGQ